MPERNLDHPLRRALAVVAVDVVLLAQALVHLFRQRARIDADAKWDLTLLGRGHDLYDLVPVRDVAGIQAQAVNARLDRQQRERVVVVDVRDHWERRSLDDLLQRFRGFAVRHRRPHDLASGLFQLVDLAQRRLDVARVRLGHRLHRDRRGSPDDHPADVDRNRLSPLGEGHQCVSPGNCPVAMR